MNGRNFVHAVARMTLLGLATAVTACTTPPTAHRAISILDALDNPRSSLGPASCAALNAVAVCEKSTPLGGVRNCGCADPRALAGGQTLRY